MDLLKRIWKFISSMQFAIILLVILALACTAGSLVTQGQTYAWYAQQYSERRAALIIALHLDDAFHSWWFILITAFLCLNLLLCNVLRMPKNIRRTKDAGDPEHFIFRKGTAEAGNVKEPEKLFSAMHFAKPVSGHAKDAKNEIEKDYLFASRNRIGLWGAWVCHLGILLLILGFGLGQMTKQQYAAYGVPGQSRVIGDTDYVLTIDDFRIGLREDNTVEQYTADITVRDTGSGASESAEISVNNPASMFGMKFYQNSTGWAARVHVTENGADLMDEVVCAGEYIRIIDKQDLVVYLNAFYPDYVMQPGVGPMTASSELKNPAYLYSVYYMDQMLGMNALLEGEELKIDEYTVTFSEPQNYTLISIKKDQFTWLAFIGGIVTLIGLILAFYTQTAQMWAVREEDGTWTVFGESRKGGVIFEEAFKEAAKAAAAEGNRK